MTRSRKPTKRHPVVSVKAVRYPVLRLVYDDGFAGEFDLSELIATGPVFEPLKNREYFKKVAVAPFGRSFGWNLDTIGNEIDFCVDSARADIEAKRRNKIAPPQMPRQDTRLESEGAEFLVLGQLLIEGIPAYKTYTNLRGYDLVATWPETNRSARIQVKSRWATDANAFLIKKVECDFLVLVRLNRAYKYSSAAKRALAAEDPEYYVLSAEAARALIAVKGWSKIVWDKEKFKPHRRRWEIIRDFLKNEKIRNRKKAK